MTSRTSLGLLFAVSSTIVAACSSSDDLMLPGGSSGSTSGDGKDGSVRTSLACSNDAIPPPVDLAPKPNGGGFCLSAPLKSLAALVGRSESEVAKVDADVLVGDCIGVDAPSGLTFVVGAALRKDETGADYARDVRVPLPSAIPGAKSIAIETGTTLLVAKATSFRGETLLRFVNVATVKQENGKRFIETLPDAARRELSSSMKVDGPGLYAFYTTSRPLGFVSGTITKDGAPVPGAVAIGTTALFLTVADANGAFTLPLARDDKASLAAFELATRWSGELAVPVESGGKTNPKTNAPVESPVKEKPIAGLDALNLAGANIALEAPGARLAAPSAFDFEDGTLASFGSGGKVEVLDEQMGTLFPASREHKYAFLTTGAGSKYGAVSRMSREIVVPQGAKELVIDYTFLSQEYPHWVGTIYNDTFVAYVAGDTKFLVVETVTGNQGQWKDFFTPIGNVRESHVDTGGVNGKFGGTTGPRRKRIPVDGCGGRTVTLVFGVSDVGDTIYDSAVAIDRISFE
jgi:hypothetical protein